MRRPARLVLAGRRRASAAPRQHRQYRGYGRRHDPARSRTRRARRPVPAGRGRRRAGASRTRARHPRRLGWTGSAAHRRRRADHGVHRGIARGVRRLGLRAARRPRGLDRGRSPPGSGRASRPRTARPVRPLGGQRPDRRPPRRASDPGWRSRWRSASTARDVPLDPERPGRGVPRRDRPGGRLPARALRERVLLGARHASARGTTYAETLAAHGWTPVLLRANTGLPLRENGVALASLLRRPGRGLAGAGRAGRAGRPLDGRPDHAGRRAAVASDDAEPWTDLVSDVVTLGTPHLGAPLAPAGSGTGAGRLGRLPETAAFGRILDWRSVGVHDLVDGLAEDVPRAAARALPAGRRHADRAGSGTRWASVRRRPAGAPALGVRPGPARSRALPRRRRPAPAARTDHFGLLNHPDVHDGAARVARLTCRWT